MSRRPNGDRATSGGHITQDVNEFGRRQHDWNLRQVRWRAVLKYQHWGGLFIFIPAVVLTAVSHWTFQERPVVRQALLYDATISYPNKPDQTIPNNLAVLYNWICLVLATLVIELLLLRRQHSLTVGITGLLHQVWCCAINFVVVLAVVEITKPFSGRLRPDFLARCQPDHFLPPSAGTETSSSTFSPTAPTLGPLHLGQIVGGCNNTDGETIKDGRLSFPSGHASNTMSVAWFTSMYVIWSMYLRHNAPYPGRLHNLQCERPGLLHQIMSRFAQELWHALVYAFVLLTLCLSWFIGITRFWDNVHNISDIIGGFLVAIIFTTPFAIKAIGLHTCIKHVIDGPDHVTNKWDEHTDSRPPLCTGGNILPVASQPSTAGAAATHQLRLTGDVDHTVLHVDHAPGGATG